MEKIKFELACEQMCAQCKAKELDICNTDNQVPEFGRCGICGDVFCMYDNPNIENHLCAGCQTIIDRNVDADNNIIKEKLFNK